MAKGFAVLVGMVAAAILYFAPMSKLEALDGRVSRGEINQEMLFQKKVILMLREKCDSGRCKQDELVCYEEAQHRLGQLREEKKELNK